MGPGQDRLKTVGSQIRWASEIPSLSFFLTQALELGKGKGIFAGTRSLTACPLDHLPSLCS